jgi:hypothetical protein
VRQAASQGGNADRVIIRLIAALKGKQEQGRKSLFLLFRFSIRLAPLYLVASVAACPAVGAESSNGCSLNLPSLMALAASPSLGFSIFFKLTGAAPPRVKHWLNCMPPLLNFSLDSQSHPRTPVSRRKAFTNLRYEVWIKTMVLN